MPLNLGADTVSAFQNIKIVIDQIQADLVALKAAFDGHTHSATVAAQPASPALTSSQVIDQVQS